MTIGRDERRRRHPESRFAGDQHLINLASAMRRLTADSESSVYGHRHQTLYKHGSLTIAAFAFDTGGVFEEQAANGVVMIHVLEGHLTVTTAGQVHEVTSGELLVLAPAVEHKIRARTRTSMLLSLNLEESIEAD